MTAIRPLVLALACCALPLAAADPGAADLDAAKAPDNGLAVQVGAGDPAFLGRLALGGRRLVQGLALDEAGRAKVLPGLISGGVHPFATVAVWDAAPRLPYADRLVTLLILDRDELAAKAPSPEECQRVVEPGGTILERVKGAWKASVVARPPGLGNWTHFDGGADGNAVSADAEATAMRGLQWIDNEREVRWAKSGPHGGEGGNVRIWDRYAVIDARIYPEDKDPKFDKRHFLECRDVNNGLLIWQVDRSPEITARRWALAVGAGRCFAWLKEDGPLCAIDLASGRTLTTYPGSEIKGYLKAPRDDEAAKGRKPEVRPGMFGNDHWIRLSGDTVLANGDGSLRAWTLDGKAAWTFTRAGSRLEMPVVDEQRGLVIGLTTPDTMIGFWNNAPVSWGRWSSSSQVTSIIALDLKTGAVAWENTELASRETDVELFDRKGVKQRLSWGQLLVSGDHVIAFQAKAIISAECSFIASIDARTGKTVHFAANTLVSTTPHGRVESAGNYCALARDGLVYIMGGFDITSYDPRSGATKKVLSVPWNARCHKPIATATSFLLGQTAFIGKDFAGEMYALARSGCAHSPVPGAGVIVFGPHMCGCTTHFDGFLATTSHPAPAPLADARRLVALATAAPLALPRPAPAEKSLLAQSWPWFTISSVVAPAAIELSGWTFRIDPQAHRLDASKGGSSWSFVADGRLGTSICVIGDRVVVGCHDGWVHGLDLATGAPRWRYCAAPAPRLIVANGMLTSAWPVMGVADLGNGQVVASAGTHPELDGGVRVVALKAADGSPVWVKTLRKPTSKIPAGGGRETQIVDRSFINAPPSVVGGKVVIAGGSHLGRVEIDPAEGEEAINARLAAMPPKAQRKK